MPLNSVDGQFGLDCWLSENDEGDPQTVYSDNKTELEAEAERLILAGRFKYIELSRWNPADQDWDVIRQYEPE